MSCTPTVIIFSMIIDEGKIFSRYYQCSISGFTLSKFNCDLEFLRGQYETIKSNQLPMRIMEDLISLVDFGVGFLFES